MTLRQFREKKGLSQAELGNRVGLKQTTISQYESGSRTPTLAMAKKLSDVLEISLD
uniref:helix-turn-helix domain-containing protein n=1 Tax=Helicobacter sp. UBA3407 TaxID=1946588 RepID=UPI00345F10E5